MVVVKDDAGRFGLRTLKPAVSQEQIDEMSFFLYAGPNVGQLKATFTIIRWE